MRTKQKNVQSLEEMVLGAQQGDAALFAEVCRRFLPLAKKLATRRHLRTIRDDAYGQALLAIAEAVRAFQPEAGADFPAFVYSRVKYALWNLFKKERRVWQSELLDAPCEETGASRLEQVPVDFCVERKIADEDEKRHLRQAVNELPQAQRFVILRLFFGGKKLAEVSEELGISPQAVYGLKARALRNLRRRQDFSAGR